jgi:hypothetical protein
MTDKQKQMTSVEQAFDWIISNIEFRGETDKKRFLSNKKRFMSMEKEQIEDAYDNGLFDGTMTDTKNRIYLKYYNETYGK